jgi:hypothetical protein
MYYLRAVRQSNGDYLDSVGDGESISQPFFEIGTFVPIYVELWFVST